MYKSNFSRSRFGGNRRGGAINGANKYKSNGRGRGKATTGDFVRAIETSKNEKIQQVKEENFVSTHKFEDFKINHQLKVNISHKNFTQPSPIQDQAIPVILEGKDLIGIANTGTGKTAAFLIPLIEKVSKDKKFQKALIVTPTRELAEQINEEFRVFSKDLGVYSALCIGGKSMVWQVKDLKRNPHFVIGTPGRIKDLITRKVLDLSQFNNVVLDETDRMVDIGFIDDIRYFIELLPKSRQSLFFSATISPKVQTILQAFVTNPVTVSVKKGETSANVEQDIIKVGPNQRKIEILHEMLIQKHFEKVLIFGRTKWGVEKLSEELIKRGFKAGAIHGDKRQSQRQRVLDAFKKSEIQVLLATDVAARGLDINNVSHVINYELPESLEDYVHRIGRTGRADKRGVALTFVDQY